eukprot:575013-Prymnesium_polylepis.1
MSRCCKLPDACIDILPNNNTLAQWRRGLNRRREPAQFRLHVAGLAEPAIRHLESGCLLQIADPLFPNRLRHLERDQSCSDDGCHTGIVHEPDSRAMRSRRVAAAANLTMLWPVWENGYGDVIADTMLPLGDMHRGGSLPQPLAVSGLKAASLVSQLLAIAPSACAFERANPASPLPRCASRCYESIRVCKVSRYGTNEAWESMAAMDTALGWRNRREEAAAFDAPLAEPATTSPPPPPPIRVLLAAREPHGGHSRVIVNQATLLERCDGSRLAVEQPRHTQLRLECRLLPAGANATTQVRLLQWAHVYMTMWGGDTINALHMRRDGIVIEMVHELFARDGPKPWVTQHQAW